MALRALDERADLAGRLADRLEKRGSVRLAGRYREQMADCKRQADLIREILENPPAAAEIESELETEEKGDAQPTPTN